MSEREARKLAKRRARATGRSSSVYVPISPHVRLYAWELECQAFRTLDPVARALLIELRALYRPSAGAEVFLSVREAMQRTGVTQRPVQSAFKALLERGWIEEAKAGSFDQKTGTGRARSFLLTNIGPAGDDVDAKRTYMRWKPYATECQKITVAPDATDRSVQHYTDQAA
ncbi:MAG: hypothetical protein ACREPD_07240 [Stenotrophomonas sp.]|uniref:hypothetical protein n=1 Tax=Stenotrophomonas sp. TaxID=69392 RepID=UPI003D6D721C